MTHVLATYLAGSICYAVSAVLGIKLRSGGRIMPAAALAPALAVAGRQLEAEGAGIWLVVAPAALVAVLLLTRRPLLEIAVHLVLLRVSMVLVSVDRGVGEEITTLVLTSLAATVAYSVGWALAESTREKAFGVHTSDSLRFRGVVLWLVAQGVLLSACGLVVLVVRELGWPAFAAILVALLLTRREFEAYARAEKAYEQTVRVLDRLTSRAAGG